MNEYFIPDSKLRIVTQCNTPRLPLKKWRWIQHHGLLSSRMQAFVASISFEQHNQGRARTQSPTTRNYAIEIPTFEEFARVSNSLSAMAEPRYG